MCPESSTTVSIRLASKFIFSQIFSPWLIGLGSAPAAEDDEDRSIPSATRAGPLILVPKYFDCYLLNQTFGYPNCRHKIFDVEQKRG